MAQIIWAEPALLELDEIADYISIDNPVAAKKLIYDVFNRVDQLEQHPKSGKSVEELGYSLYREIYVSPCRIFYRVNDEQDAVHIIHIIRDEQLLHSNRLFSR